MRSKAFILALILIFPALMAPLAMADTAQYKPRAEVPGDMCYATRVGSFYDSDLFIPIKKTGADIWTGIVFPEIYLAGYTVISQANLTLYFTLDFSGGVGETVTVYGYEDYLEAGTFESSAQLVYGPLTDAHLNIDVSAITSGGFYTFNVTAIVNELLAHQWWTPGASLCFIVYGAGETVTRYVSSNEWSPAQFPILDLSFNVPPSVPESWLNYNRTYKGYDLFEGSPGFRSFIFKDFTNNTEFLINYNYMWSDYLGQYYLNATSRHTLPENTIIINGGWPGYTIRNNYVNVEMDLWLLTDPGSTRQVNLWRSQDQGVTWSIMYRFNYTGTTNYPTGYTMVYNPALNRLHILVKRTVGLDIAYCYYDIDSDTGSALTSIISASYSLNGMDIVCDYETDNLYVCANGGATSSSTYMLFKQRIGDVWSAKYTSDNPSTWGVSQTQLQWSQNNKRLNAVSILSASGVKIAVLYEKGEAYDAWPSYNAYDLILSLTSLDNGLTSVLTEIYPGDLNIDELGVQYRKNDRWYKSISTYPYESSTKYDPFYVSPAPKFYSGVIFIAPLPKAIGSQADRKYLCSLELDYDNNKFYELFEPGGFVTTLGLANHLIYTHDHAIKAITAPKDPFGQYGVYIYLNGSLVTRTDDLDDALNYIDDLGGPPDPEDPSPPGWGDEEIFTRYQVILYLTIAGLAAIIAPPTFMAYKKDLSLIAPVLFIMAVGASLLLYVQYI